MKKIMLSLFVIISTTCFCGENIPLWEDDIMFQKYRCLAMYCSIIRMQHLVQTLREGPDYPKEMILQSIEEQLTLLKAGLGIQSQ
jgi:hypothetical protein